MEIAGGVAVGPEADESIRIPVVVGPEQCAVGFRYRKRVYFAAGKEGKLPFVNSRGKRLYSGLAVEEEHEPMPSAFIAFFGDVAKAVKSSIRNSEADFFLHLTAGTFVGGFPGSHVQLASDGGPASFVGSLGAFDQEVFPGLVADKD